MADFSFVVWFFLLTLDFFFWGCVGSKSEDQLRKFLFEEREYNPLPLPIKNNSEILTILFDLALTQIIDVDEKNQVFVSKVWLKQGVYGKQSLSLNAVTLNIENYIWHDYKLAWEPSQFGYITSIKIPVDKIWTPDILIYNNADGPYDMMSKSSMWASVNYNGTVTWFPPVVYKSSCKINVLYYPFDEQNCTIKFGSWVYDGFTVDLVPVRKTAIRKDYWSNGEWKIANMPCFRNVVKYPCCTEEYVDITYHFQIRRQPLYYFAYLLLPCALISFNTVLVFYLPPDTSEKMALCTAILLSLAVFLLLVTQQIPANANNFPLIVKYLTFTMVVVSSSICLTVFVLNIRFRSPDTHHMSSWVRVIFIDTLPKFLGMKRPDRYNRKYRTVGISVTRDAMNRNHLDTKQIIMENKGNNYTVRMRDSLDVNTESDSETDATGNCKLNHRFLPSGPADTETAEGMMVHRAVEEIMFLTSRTLNDQDMNQAREDWKYIAMVIDRVFLIVYSCTVFAGTLAIIFEAPLAVTFFKDIITFTGLEEEYTDDAEYIVNITIA